MSAAVKMRPIKKAGASAKYHFKFKKTTPKKVLAEIFIRYSAYLEEEPDYEPVDITTTGWYKTMEAEMKPGDYLRNLREAHGLTQKTLGEKLNTNAAHVSDWETGQRTISKAVARKLGGFFNTSPGIFI